MIKGFLNLPWFLWAALAFILAMVWVHVGPHTKLPAISGYRYFIIRWGHALTWFLLAINFVLRGIDSSLKGLASFCAIVGGVMYVLFLARTFVVK
jgi:hypothetical protein